MGPLTTTGCADPSNPSKTTEPRLRLGICRGLAKLGPNGLPFTFFSLSTGHNGKRETFSPAVNLARSMVDKANENSMPLIETGYLTIRQRLQFAYPFPGLEKIYLALSLFKLISGQCMALHSACSFVPAGL